MKEQREAHYHKLANRRSMEMRMMTRRILGGLLAVGSGLVLSACGSGFAPAAFLGSDSSSTPRVSILDQDPAPGSEFAEPIREIDISFSDDIADFELADQFIILSTEDPSVPLGTPGADLSSFFEETERLVEDIEVSENEAKLRLSHPLTLAEVYYVGILPNKIETLSGRPFVPEPSLDEDVWHFETREGVLEEVQLVDLLDPIGTLNYVHPDSGISDNDLDALVVIEGEISNVPVIATSVIREEGGQSSPTLLATLSSPALDGQTSQAGTFVSEKGLTSVVWQEGRPFCSGANSQMPDARIRVSQFVRVGQSDGAWETGASVPMIDPSEAQAGNGGVQSSSTNYISWKPELCYTNAEDTLAVWWAWSDFDMQEQEFDTWAVYGARRAPTAPGTSIPAWDSPVRLSPVDPDESGAAATDVAFGWPFMDVHKAENRAYALWGRAELGDAPYRRDTLFERARMDEYWVAVFENGEWSPGQKLGNPSGELLPRPTSFVVDDRGRGLVVGSLDDDTIVAYSVDLQGTTSFNLSQPVTLDLDGKLVDDGVSGPGEENRCGVGFGSVRGKTGRKAPRARLLPPEDAADALVTWFEDAAAGAILVRSATFDGEWGTPEIIAEIEPVAGSNTVRASGGGVMIDALGNRIVRYTAEYRFIEDSNGNGEIEGGEDEFVSSALYVLRRAATETTWCPLQVKELCTDTIGDPEECRELEGMHLTDVSPDGMISDPNRSINSGNSSSIHPSGQIIFSWAEPDGTGQGSLFSFLRRYR